MGKESEKPDRLASWFSTPGGEEGPSSPWGVTMQNDARNQPGPTGTDPSSGRARPAGEARPGAGPEKPLPLSGLRVIDVGTFLAGPYAASIMGEFAAEVPNTAAGPCVRAAAAVGCARAEDLPDTAAAP